MPGPPAGRLRRDRRRRRDAGRGQGPGGAQDLALGAGQQALASTADTFTRSGHHALGLRPPRARADGDARRPHRRRLPGPGRRADERHAHPARHPGPAGGGHRRRAAPARAARHARPHALGGRRTCRTSTSSPSAPARTPASPPCSPTPGSPRSASWSRRHQTTAVRDADAVHPALRRRAPGQPRPDAERGRRRRRGAARAGARCRPPCRRWPPAAPTRPPTCASSWRTWSSPASSPPPRTSTWSTCRATSRRPSSG